MKLTLFPLLVALTLGGCAGTSPEAATPTDAPRAVAATAAQLQAQRWVLETATDGSAAPMSALFGGGAKLSLSFDKESVQITGGCNSLGGSYSLAEGGKLSVGPLRATLMACAPELMAADQAMSSLLPKLTQATLDGESRLRLVAPSGETTVWVGSPTAEARYGEAKATLFFEVAPARVACQHPLIKDHQCLSVRRLSYDANGIKQEPTGAWEPLFAEIEGFEFKEGQRSVLRVKQYERAQPPADASSIVYVLDLVVESELAKP